MFNIDAIWFNNYGKINAVNNIITGHTLYSDFIIMEYTGLKAKNGEIYEGDIVRVKRSDSLSKRNKGIIVYGRGAYGFYSFIENTWVSIFEWPIDKIIGNIYEHPLEKK